MRKCATFLVLLFGFRASFAADLIEVYKQALVCDPTFQQAIAQRFSAQEGVMISAAGLLPNITFTANPSLTRTGYAGSAYSIDPGTGIALSPRNNTARASTIRLTATQTIFNFAQFAYVANQISVSEQAGATLNAALQDLMVRVEKAYFAILQDEDNVTFSAAAMNAYEEQLKQVTQMYKVGIRTITEMYTAKASYDTSVANYYTAKRTLANDRENLRAITGKYYEYLEPLNEDFPLIEPNPNNLEVWIDITLQQNWQIKAAQYDVSAKRHLIQQQFASHLPILTMQGMMDRQYTDNENGYNTLINRSGPSSQTDRQLSLNLTMPIFSGGGIVALTNQAVFNYEAAQQNLEFTTRKMLTLARQSFLDIIIEINEITADKFAVDDNKKALTGMEVSFKVGTTSLVDVLNQRQKLFQSQIRFADDRYTYVNDIFQLKFAAGTLSFEDLKAVNCWLGKSVTKQIKTCERKTSNHHQMLAKAKKTRKAIKIFQGKLI